MALWFGGLSGTATVANWASICTLLALTASTGFDFHGIVLLGALNIRTTGIANGIEKKDTDVIMA